ncbi:MAG: MaoC/PaaZ C-terminal domain-containing protein [Sinimarinibacterium flocculans]|uniref:MaoC/PaaZ C-terminal domain-containing protein n=1 Tax=Sinimarinibacterium flocculans TaxID=985250 RepID=UPI002EC205AC|nr:MaoC/PaaZ C-terminal domain-containing protein [Pseudomonadota bacterium]
MSSVSPSQVEVGHTLPTLRLPAVDRTMLALFAGASGDHVPLHIDTDFARRAGMPDVFAHGMLGMAWVGRLITEWAPQSALRSLSVRFVAITHLGNQPVLTGKVVELLEQEGERRARLEVQMANQYGQIKILGEALVALA